MGGWGYRMTSELKRHARSVDGRTALCRANAVHLQLCDDDDATCERCRSLLKKRTERAAVSRRQPSSETDG